MSRIPHCFEMYLGASSSTIFISNSMRACSLRQWHVIFVRSSHHLRWQLSIAPRVNIFKTWFGAAFVLWPIFKVVNSMKFQFKVLKMTTKIYGIWMANPAIEKSLLIHSDKWNPILYLFSYLHNIDISRFLSLASSQVHCSLLCF